MANKINLILGDDGVTLEIQTGDVAHGTGRVSVVLLTPAEARSLAGRLTTAAEHYETGDPPESECSN